MRNETAVVGFYNAHQLSFTILTDESEESLVDNVWLFPRTTPARSELSYFHPTPDIGTDIDAGGRTGRSFAHSSQVLKLSLLASAFARIGGRNEKKKRKWGVSSSGLSFEACTQL